MNDQREQQVLERLEQARRRPPAFTAPRIDMSHGAGGKATHKLIEGLLLPALTNPALAPLSDAALLPFGASRLALTTDAFVVHPLIFPGGSIGELAVNGTVNDLAVAGAVPLGLSAALIIEEGLDTGVLRRVAGGEDAAVIGEVRAEPARMVLMHTGFGGTRMIDMLVGDPHASR